jgi:hypothetical protein
VNLFIQKHCDVVTGSLSGFDRLVFRGTLRFIAYVKGMMSFLADAKVLLKNFGAYVERATRQIKDAALALAHKAARPITYLPSAKTKKEDIARAIAERDHITDGLVCVISCVETSKTFDIFKNRDTKRLELVSRLRNCLHIYHYFIHPRFGFMYTRLQTWFPFNFQVGLNGREWLARDLDRTGLGYVRRDNAFTWLEDCRQSQKLMDRQLTLDWPRHLDALVRKVNPALADVLAVGNRQPDYYWSVWQSEWATDAMFKDAKTLATLYPKLVHHGITHFGSRDVLRFLGRKVTADGHIPANFAGEVISDLRERPEGLRIKHRVAANSIKLYDKQGSVLRAETTVNRPADFKVFRPKEGDPKGTAQWRPLRLGVADLHRRAVLSQAVNDRYLDALAAVDHTVPLSEFAQAVCRPVRWKGKRVRALNPWSPQDAALLEAVNRGQFVVNGFRNRDLRALLFKTEPNSKKDERSRSAKATRAIRMLRAHGLVSKVPKTHRYMLTLNGRRIITALLAARAANTASLIEKAA